MFKSCYFTKECGGGLSSVFKESLHGGSRDTFIEVRAGVPKIYQRYCTEDTSEVLC